MKAARGFSLVELVVTLVIAAILAALLLPRLYDGETNAAWYHEQVRAGIRYAQRQAVAQRRQVCVEIQPNGLRLLYRDGADCTTGAVLTQISNGEAYVLSAPAGVVVTPTTTFYFDGLGRPDTGVTVGVNGMPITVHAETGYVQ